MERVEGTTEMEAEEVRRNFVHSGVLIEEAGTLASACGKYKTRRKAPTEHPACLLPLRRKRSGEVMALQRLHLHVYLGISATAARFLLSGSSYACKIVARYITRLLSYLVAQATTDTNSISDFTFRSPKIWDFNTKKT